VARYVIPEINGFIAKLREVETNSWSRTARVFEARGASGDGQDHGERKRRAAALPLTGPGRVAIPAVNAPDLQKEAAKTAGRQAQGVRGERPQRPSALKTSVGRGVDAILEAIEILPRPARAGRSPLAGA